MDNVTLIAFLANAAAFLAHAAALFVWKGQITERVEGVLRAHHRLELEHDRLEADLRTGGCPAFGVRPRGSVQGG